MTSQNIQLHTCILRYPILVYIGENIFISIYLPTTLSLLDYINRKLETKLLRYRLNMKSSGIVAIVLFYCVYAQSGRATYLLVDLEEPATLGKHDQYHLLFQ